MSRSAGRERQDDGLAFAAVLVPAVWTVPDWLGSLGIERELLKAGRGYTRALALKLVPTLVGRSCVSEVQEIVCPSSVIPRPP